MISANQAHYIKLGQGGEYEKFCFKKGQDAVALGFHDAPHGVPFNPKATYDFYKRDGRPERTCTSFMNQVAKFYEADEKTLWFTFSDGKLFWCFASPGITMITKDNKDTRPSRYRNTIDGWHDKDMKGEVLYIHSLNGNLTKAQAYRSTIFTLDDERLKYLLARINGEELPEIIEARKNKSAILHSIHAMMRMLNPYDFELLVELVFARSGWQRLSSTGGTQKIIDIELYLPTTEERAFVQVKSETSQEQLEEYESYIDKMGFDRMFYVYHTTQQVLKQENPKTKLLHEQQFAQMVLDAGLFDWLLKKAR